MEIIFKFLYKLIIFIVCSLLFTSCVKDTIEVEQYCVVNVEHSVNMRSEPNAKSKIVAKIPLKQEVFLLDDEVTGDGWLHVKTRSGGTGYVHKDFIKKRKVQKKATRAEILENAGQRCAVIFAKMDAWKNSDSGVISGNALMIIILLLSAALALTVHFLPVTRWLHYILALLLSASIIYYYAFVPDGSLDVDSWFLRLFFGILMVTAPIMLYYSLFMMLFAAWNDGDWYADEEPIKLHILISIIMFVAFLICIFYFPKRADVAMCVFGLVQAVIFLVLFVKSIASHRFKCYLLYLFVFSALFIPAAVLSFHVIIVVLPVVLIIGALLSPSSGRVSTGGSTSELLDEAGRHVADIDGSGRDANTGKRYGRDSNGNWHEV